MRASFFRDFPTEARERCIPSSVLPTEASDCRRLQTERVGEREKKKSGGEREKESRGERKMRDSYQCNLSYHHIQITITNVYKLSFKFRGVKSKEKRASPDTYSVM